MSISQEGKLISTAFAELRRSGFIVTNFNTHKLVKSGSMQKLTDYIIIGHTGIHFIEVKLSSTKDNYKTHQLELRELLYRIGKETIWVNYWHITNLEEAHFAFDCILSGTPLQKQERPNGL